MQQQLDDWLNKIRRAGNQQEVFQLLDQFRSLPWTDDQCAVMAKTYMPILGRLEQSKQKTSSSTPEAADGPVWYEKM